MKKNKGKVLSVVLVFIGSALIFAILPNHKDSDRIFNQGSICILIIQDGVYQYLSDAFSFHGGYSIEEMMNWTPEDMINGIYPDDQLFVVEQMRLKQMGLGDAVSRYNYRLIAKNGAIHYMDSYSRPITFNGKAADFVALFDVTKHTKNAEGISNTGLLIIQDGLIKYVNNESEAIIGYSQEEMLSWKPNAFWELVFADDREMVQSRLQARIKGDKNIPSSYTFRAVTKTGQIKRLALESSLGQYDGKPAIYAMLQDISENKNVLDDALDAKSLSEDQLKNVLRFDSLGTYYFENGDYGEAEKYLLEALDIKITAFGPNHIRLADDMQRLARIRYITERPYEAFGYYLRQQECLRGFIDIAFSYASERQKFEYLRHHPLIDNSFLSFAVENPVALESALEMIAVGKGKVLEKSVEQKEISFCVDDSVTKTILDEYNQACKTIANIIMDNTGNLNILADKTLKEAISRKEALETELNSRCVEFAEARAQRNVRIDDIARSLPSNSALWEIIKYRPYRFSGKGRDKQRTMPERYLVFQLTDDKKIDIVDLGDAETIDRLVHKYLEKMRAFPQTVNAVSEKKLTESINGDSRRLFDVVFQPLVKHLQSNRRIFISPDGELNLLCYNALLCPDDKYVVEKYDISYLSSGRDLLAFAHRDNDVNSGQAIVIANPDFNFGMYPVDFARMQAYWDSSGYDAQRDSVSRKVVTKIRSSGCLNELFQIIPFSGFEGEIVSNLFRELGGYQADYYSGADVTKSILQDILIPPAYLHIATHYYYCPGIVYDDTGGFFYTPLFYSGLALAGADSVLLKAAGDSTKSIPDNYGMFTSFEIATLNLFGTELVTLGACNTGVGEIMDGEGVFGLRRSFQQAGTATVMMSLWEVSDEHAYNLITDFYELHLSGGGKSESLREAILNALNRGREAGQGYHPFYWGAFVLVGDPE